MMLRDYFAHVLIDTPLHKPAEYLRKISRVPKRWKHPELDDVYLESSRIEQMMNELIQDSMNCVDIGCHVGSMLTRMLNLSPHGHHIAIEPVPYKVKWLQRKFPNVEVHQAALSDKVGKLVYYSSGQESLVVNEKLNPFQVRPFTVKCTRLDDLLPQQNCVHFIKIDVEGNELAVLRGAEQVLTRCQPILLFECTRGGLTRFNFTPKDIFNFLTHRHHYSIFLVKDWLEGNKPLNFKNFAHSMEYPFQAFNFLAVAS